MEDKILSKFHAWDEAVSSEFFDKKFQIPNDLVGDLTSKNGKLKIDFEDSEAYWDGI
jgi:hypothetical protein